uniref:Uncharacterized protein n=1 Tax=Panagrolaimus sp. ES5 TaxID=591445 RepID=A0AC34F617_9BILA
MEDLSENGIVLTKYDFVLVDKIKVVVKEIAQMQAEWIKASMEVEWTDGGFEENEKMWAKITEDFLSFIPAFIDLVDDKEKVKNVFNKIMVLAGNKDYHVWAFQDAYKELGLPTVLATVILQITGSPAADLTRYLLLNAEGHVRRKIESTIFSFYIECINSEIPNIKFNKNQIRKAYIYAFISEFMGLLMITVNNAKTLQHSINNGENVAHNLKIKNKIILQALDAMEDVEKFMDVELADIVERFKISKNSI